MYQPDETQKKLMQAHGGLISTAKEANAEADWALRMLVFLISAHDVGPSAVETAVEEIVSSRDRIQKAVELISNAEEVINNAASALEFARGKIPNTTPPDPRGFERCSAPAGNDEPNLRGGEPFTSMGDAPDVRTYRAPEEGFTSMGQR